MRVQVRNVMRVSGWVRDERVSAMAERERDEQTLSSNEHTFKHVQRPLFKSHLIGRGANETKG